ncbi:hypothetical protein ACFPES_14525 [Paenibacillus sp. GCM10023248]|uniref:hypothetical protein n=1 Tax=unclassified Paenibacillus TaxID=185978 RepID=UPI002379189E|nr:hypothetical protein [Paenibacillus sp. MAHUQ-63]MDD9268251.1 hypothetical protein [Paenibacillus sp. MAHUQ-63]
MTTIYLAVQDHAAARILFGASLLKQALEEAGYRVEEAGPWELTNYRELAGSKIFVGNRYEAEILRGLEEQEVLCYHTEAPREEGFYLATLPGGLTVVAGGSDTGTLYGCQELAAIIREERALPDRLAFGDAPSFVLRGPALGLQKTKVEPPRRTYEYPVTPARFPWFYDKALWLDFLDMLLEQRCNVVYIWTGHPFSSFVKLDDYPEALEVTEDEFKLNVETFHWLAEEGNKRGIWIVLKFYNIHIPLPFAEKHGLELHQPKPLPLTSDYYKKSISAFVRKFPNVGLMVCLGEALQGQLYGAEWLTETILEAVNEGLKDMQLKEKPPIIVRAHAINAESVMAAALPLYPNLYTEAKFNGESLTTFTPRGRWQNIHNHLSSLDTIHMINVHILANLEPFRWGSPSFIQKSMQAAKYRLGANGLHLYPLFYWDWPYSPDQASPRLRQFERDWIWFASWFRYAWNPDRDPKQERRYWIDLLARRYGSREAGEAILAAYEESGECAPKLLRRFGITEGNRQTMVLGMTLSQLTNPERYMPWKELWECQAPQGERLETFVVRELRGEPHIGETPLDIIADVERNAEQALRAVRHAGSHVSRNKKEFQRLETDVAAIRLMTYSYTYKVRAAIDILTYKHTVGSRYLDRTDLLESARVHAEVSLNNYRELTALTDSTYLYANSMQTPQRKVPFPNGETYGHWRDCLPLYEQEYDNLSRQVQQLKEGRLPAALNKAARTIEPYKPAPFVLHSANAETYKIDKQQYIFNDGDVFIQSYAEELQGLTGVRFSQREASKQGVQLEIELPEKSQILVGYFNSPDSQWLKAPNLEENTHADDQGGLVPILSNGMKVYFYPSLNIHAYTYEAGRHTLVFGKGAYLLVGVISAEQKPVPRDVTHDGENADTMDWLYSGDDHESKRRAQPAGGVQK